MRFRYQILMGWIVSDFVLPYFMSNSSSSLLITFPISPLHMVHMLLQFFWFNLLVKTIGVLVPQETEGHPSGEKEDPWKAEQQPVGPGPEPHKKSRSRLGREGGRRQLKDLQVAWALGTSWLLSRHEITTCMGNGTERVGERWKERDGN